MTDDQDVKTAAADRAETEARRQEEFNNLWDEIAAELGPEYDGAFHAFMSLLPRLVSRAQEQGVSDKQIMELLIYEALKCRPEDQVCILLDGRHSELANRFEPQKLDERRLSRLLHKVYGLIVCGDEDEIENILRRDHQEGSLDDKELRSELAKIGKKPRHLGIPQLSAERAI
jgi:hypothetical protein